MLSFRASVKEEVDKTTIAPLLFFFLVLQFAAHLKFTFVFSSPATKEGGALIEHWYDKMILDASLETPAKRKS